MGWQLPYGATAANLAAMQIRARMARYGLEREQLGAIAVTQRTNAAANASAVYRDPLTLDDYLSSRMVSDPLCLYDCDVPCDGATAFVISRSEHRTAVDHPAVEVVSANCAQHERFSWDAGEDITRISSRWASELWDRSDHGPSDVDVAALYDGFSVFVLCWLEDLGFCGVGESGEFIGDGTRIRRDGTLPLNTGGGQLSGGRLHGFGHLYEACLQLRGECGDRQVLDAQLAAVGVGAANSGTTALLLRRSS